MKDLMEQFNKIDLNSPDFFEQIKTFNKWFEASGSIVIKEEPKAPSKKKKS